MIELRAAALSDVGRERDHNEDSCYASAHVFVVADGLGGHRGGEVASALAVEALKPLTERAPSEAAGALAEAIRTANRTVYDRSRSNSNLTGMGTTMTAAVIDGPRAHLAHVGDSRAYLLRNGSIEQLTDDHTMVAGLVRDGRITPEEAERHPQRSMVTRALGSDSRIVIDEFDVDLEPGDHLLLCSDGLTNMLSDGEIAVIIRDGKGLDETCAALIESANQRGGVDNITAVLIEVGGTLDGEPARPAAASRSAGGAPRRRIPRRAIWWTAIILAVSGLALGGLRIWANGSWFVGETGGEVAVFQGLSFDLPLIRTHRVVQRTGISLSDLPEFLRRDLTDGGITASSQDDARRIVTEQIRPQVAQTEPEPVPSP